MRSAPYRRVPCDLHTLGQPAQVWHHPPLAMPSQINYYSEKYPLQTCLEAHLRETRSQLRFPLHRYTKVCVKLTTTNQHCPLQQKCVQGKQVGKANSCFLRCGLDYSQQSRRSLTLCIHYVTGLSAECFQSSSMDIYKSAQPAHSCLKTGTGEHVGQV